MSARGSGASGATPFPPAAGSRPASKSASVTRRNRCLTLATLRIRVPERHHPPRVIRPDLVPRLKAARDWPSSALGRRVTGAELHISPGRVRDRRFARNVRPAPVGGFHDEYDKACCSRAQGGTGIRATAAHGAAAVGWTVACGGTTCWCGACSRGASGRGGCGGAGRRRTARRPAVGRKRGAAG